jgi:antitoxin component YwqK of YwqJK toxin-antitoxin module
MDRYVYKAGSCSIITLEITGKTNEKRSGIVDPLHAKFRTDKALVIDIENFETKEKMKEDYSNRDLYFIYRVGEEVKVVNYNEDIHEVCTTGIHYFKTKEAAESWMGHDLDGLHRNWHENGQLWIETNYQNGKRNGSCREYYENGNLRIECNYKDGERDGVYREWYYSGNIEKETNYKDGKLNGVYRKYYENGGLGIDCNYKDGELETQDKINNYI